MLSEVPLLLLSNVFQHVFFIKVDWSPLWGWLGKKDF